MRKRNTHAFTIVELLVVIALAAMLIAITVPALGHAKEGARRIQCLSNQRQTVGALGAYTNEHKGFMPDWTHIGTYSFEPNPYIWVDRALVKPMTPYMNSTKLMNCPSVPRRNPQHWTFGALYIKPPSVWFSRQMMVAGLADEKILGHSGLWYDTPPSAPSLNLHNVTNPSAKIAIADMYVWQGSGTNIGWVNHGGGDVIYGLSNFLASIHGGNRTYCDGHGEWARPSQMGRNGSPITPSMFESRFNVRGRRGGDRLCYW